MTQFMNWSVDVPEHWLVLHCSVSILLPAHVNPLVHVRCLTLVPPLQVLLQDDQDPHSLQEEDAPV